MHAKNLFIDQGANGQTVENIGENFPKLNGVAALALVIETVNTVDLCALVVTSQQEEVFRVLDLITEKQCDSLDRLLATVDVVTEEQVVCLWWEASVFEETQQIVILAMHVT